MTDAGHQQMKVQLRALDESLAESGRLHKLTELAAIDPGLLGLFAVPAHCPCIRSLHPCHRSRYTVPLGCCYSP